MTRHTSNQRFECLEAIERCFAFRSLALHQLAICRYLHFGFRDAQKTSKSRCSAAAVNNAPLKLRTLRQIGGQTLQRSMMSPCLMRLPSIFVGSVTRSTFELNSSTSSASAAFLSFPSLSGCDFGGGALALAVVLVSSLNIESNASTDGSCVCEKGDTTAEDESSGRRRRTNR